MKTNPRPSGKMDMEKAINEAFPRADENIKESKLVRKLKSSLDKVAEDDVKIFNFGTGARSKLQFTQYPSVCQNNRQIFDTTKIFKTMSQIDSLAHKIGSDILQYLFIIRKNIPLSKRSMRFVERESERNFRGQLCLMQEEFKESADLFARGVIDLSQFNADLDRLICDMETPERQKIAARILDDLCESDGLEKAKSRIRQRKHRELEAKYSGLKEINKSDI